MTSPGLPDEELTAFLVRGAGAFHDRRDPSRSRRLWAAVMLTPYLDVCRSILNGKPVRAGRLERVALERALRGEPLPDPDAYIVVTADMLEAVAEGGAL